MVEPAITISNNAGTRNCPVSTAKTTEDNIRIVQLIKNHNTVAVGERPNPILLHPAVISPVAGSGIDRFIASGDTETHRGHTETYNF